MWLQQKLNPAPTDPTQAMIFAWMPWVFMFMLGGFASGLVLYWIANNVITFTQQYIDHAQPWLQARRVRQHQGEPGLAAVSARTEADGRIALRHPERPPLSFAPETEADALMAWVTPIWPADRPAPARLIRAPGHGMTDMPDPFVSIGSLSSLRALSQRAGMALDPRRFRINLWVDGLPPWEEADAIGARWTVGGVPLDIAEPIGRCRAPEANPETGRRDAATNRLLEDAQGTTDFGVYARVAAPGTVRVGDAVKTG
jgi:hypothetical protein